jgi:hypothetical protein
VLVRTIEIADGRNSPNFLRNSGNPAISMVRTLEIAEFVPIREKDDEKEFFNECFLYRQSNTALSLVSHLGSEFCFLTR